jgi:hypothetical protein
LFSARSAIRRRAVRRTSWVLAPLEKLDSETLCNEVNVAFDSHFAAVSETNLNCPVNPNSGRSIIDALHRVWIDGDGLLTGRQE